MEKKMALTKKDMNDFVCMMDNVFDDITDKMPEHKKELRVISDIVRSVCVIVKNLISECGGS